MLLAKAALGWCGLLVARRSPRAPCFQANTSMRETLHGWVHVVAAGSSLSPSPLNPARRRVAPWPGEPEAEETSHWVPLMEPAPQQSRLAAASPAARLSASPAVTGHRGAERAQQFAHAHDDAGPSHAAQAGPQSQAEVDGEWEQEVQPPGCAPRYPDARTSTDGSAIIPAPMTMSPRQGVDAAGSSTAAAAAAGARSPVPHAHVAAYEADGGGDGFVRIVTPTAARQHHMREEYTLGWTAQGVVVSEPEATAAGEEATAAGEEAGVLDGADAAGAQAAPHGDARPYQAAAAAGDLAA